MSWKSTSLFSRSILPIGVPMGSKRFFSLSWKTAAHCNTSLLQGLHTIEAKCFVLTLIVMKPRPLLKPPWLKRSINRLGHTKSSLWKMECWWWLIGFITKISKIWGPRRTRSTAAASWSRHRMPWRARSTIIIVIGDCACAEHAVGVALIAIIIIYYTRNARERPTILV